MIKPESGDVLVDGESVLRNIDSWRNNIGYIPQNIYLSDDTIKNNIALGIAPNDINESNIAKAVKAAQLNIFINNLEEGLDTIVGERGVKISGGQKQRIGIARALYHNPELLIMDEATSALDNVTEKHVIDSIESLKGDRTIIMIAHRLTTVINCDQIILMKGGEVIDQGTYNHLLETNSIFQKMALVD